jgi:hypothetical protein
MDQLQISPETQQGLQNLSAKDKQELNQFVVGETQKAQIQSSTRAPILQTKATLCCLGNIFTLRRIGGLLPLFQACMLIYHHSHPRAQLRLL